MRLDKWLWAARLFKTRSLASQAVDGGRVQVNGAHAKPARAVAVGDELRVRREQEEMIVLVRGLSEQRRGAPEAQLLYQETEASQTARQAAREANRLLRAGAAPPAGRPGKKDRRLIRKFIKKEP